MILSQSHSWAFGISSESIRTSLPFLLFFCSGSTLPSSQIQPTGSWHPASVLTFSNRRARKVFWNSFRWLPMLCRFKPVSLVWPSKSYKSAPPQLSELNWFSSLSTSATACCPSDTQGSNSARIFALTFFLSRRQTLSSSLSVINVIRWPTPIMSVTVPISLSLSVSLSH